MTKEILIQDVDAYSDSLYTKYQIYRRDKVSGIPLYFAPYFTSKDPKGIKSLSKVLGVVEIPEGKSANDYLDVLRNCSSKSANPSQIYNLWKAGIDFDRSSKQLEQKYYLLDTPVNLKVTVTKTGLALPNQLPKNFAISFDKFIAALLNYF